MRTTLDLDDDLMIRAKIRAAERRTSLKSVMEDALRDLLVGEPVPRKRVSLPTGRLNFPEDLDLTSNAAVLDYLDSLD